MPDWMVPHLLGTCSSAREGIEPTRDRPVTFVSAGLPRRDPQTLTAMAGLLEGALSLVD
jgi:hypothetical protein